MNKSTRKKLEEHILSEREKHYKIAWSHVKNKEDALDIIQDSIYKALSYKGDVNAEHIETWFCSVLINTSRDYLRKHAKITVLEESQLAQEIEKNSVTPMDTNFEERDMLNSALEKLTDIEREIIILRYFENMELSRVAEVTSKNLSTVKSTLYRSLRKLRSTLQ